VGFSSEDWYATYSIIIRYLDQLLTFAFESAPDSVIARWAGNHEGLSAADVIDRVKRMRARMPVLARLWRSKSMSVLPQLAEPDFVLAAGPDADEEPYALLSI